jgi:hypothetical protein
VLLLLGAGGAVVWVERHDLLAWYYLGKLEKSSGEDGKRWARRLAGLGERVVPELIQRLGRDDAELCANVQTAFNCLAEDWGRDDPRCAELINEAVKEFARLSCPGRRVVLETGRDWLDGPACSPVLVAACGRLLGEVCHGCPSEQQCLAIELALRVVRHRVEGDKLCAGRELVRSALRSADAATRVRALQLAVAPGIDLRKEAVPLLQDAEPLVRRAAMLAVGEEPDAIATDNLLPWLHDADAEVRRLCELALRSPKRGLKPQHIELARLISDPRWEVRVTVLDHLGGADDLDPAVWLRRLSHDSSPAVRAAAIRAAGESTAVDLVDRLEEMAREDPSPTVSALARHYLSQRRRTALPRDN